MRNLTLATMELPSGPASVRLTTCKGGGVALTFVGSTLGGGYVSAVARFTSQDVVRLALDLERAAELLRAVSRPAPSGKRKGARHA